MRCGTRSSAETSCGAHRLGCTAMTVRPVSTTLPWLTVKQYGVTRLLDELASELKDGTYRPMAARRVFIPKPTRNGSFGHASAVDDERLAGHTVGRL